MKTVFVDLEMKPVAREFSGERSVCGREVIQFGAVKLDENRNVIDRFGKYVRPVYGPIPLYITELTGITNEQVRGEEPFETVIQQFAEFCSDSDRIYSWSMADLFQIRSECALKAIDFGSYRFEKRWNDYQEEFARNLGLVHILSLEKALEIIAAPQEGQKHDAIWDAVNTALLYRLERDPETVRTVQRIHQLVNYRKPSTYSIAAKLEEALRIAS